MIAAAERPNIKIWLAAGLAALALHAALALPLIKWRDPVPGDAGSEPVLIDLAPLIEAPQAETPQDLAPGPLQEETQAQPEPPKPEPQQTEKVEPLPAIPNAEAVLPKPREKPVEKPKAEPKPAARVTTAPPRPHVAAAQAADWHRRIAIQLERHKAFPASARAAEETGVATVAFTLARDGRVLSARLVSSSHAAALDEAALATVHRAAPYPPPPASLPGQRFDFTVPIRFGLR